MSENTEFHGYHMALLAWSYFQPFWYNNSV